MTWKLISVFILIFGHSRCRSEIVTICQDDTQRLRCPDDQIIYLKSIFWGRDDHTTCVRQSIASSKTCSHHESAESTARQRCEGKSSCVIGANKWTFGDDCPGISKYLRIEYECSNFMKVRLCSFHPMRIQCPHYQTLSIQEAFWGRKNGESCGKIMGKSGQENCEHPGASSEIQEQCNGKQSCLLQPNPLRLGDPCPDTSKYLEVTYQCVDTLVAMTECGPAVGQREQFTDLKGEQRTILLFNDIPYAKPPVGPLRLRRPVPISRERGNCWNGLLAANETKGYMQTVMCPQLHTDLMVGNEDCLYLDVRTPSRDGKRPVLLWIHGGSLTIGYKTATGYHADAEFTSAMDVVSVNINYRLGMLGFLTLEENWVTSGEGKAYGNFGFMDQIEALRWVKRNIANFGGDPESITIMGESAGAESTFSLLSSPMATGLFHKVIGTSEAINALEGKRDYKRVAKLTREKFLPLVKCNETINVRQCLEALHAGSFVSNLVFYDNLDVSPDKEDPGGLVTVEPVVLPISPWNFNSINFPDRKIPVLMGSLAQEIGLWSSYKLPEDSYTYFLGASQLALNPFNTSLIQYIPGLYPRTVQSGSETVIISGQKLWETMVSDLGFTCPMNDLARLFASSKNHDVYRFYIEHSPENLNMNAYHTWDIAALFDFKLAGTYTPTSRDKILRDNLRTVYKEFIHDGKVMSEWKKVPFNTMVIGNSPGVNFVSGEPQQRQCDFFAQNGVSRFASKEA